MLLEDHKARARTFGHRPADSHSSTHTATGLAPAIRDADASPLSPPPSAQAPMDHRQANAFAAAAGQLPSLPPLPQLTIRSSTPVSRPDPPSRPPPHGVHIRSGSIMSMATEEELASLAEILSPTVSSPVDATVSMLTSESRRLARTFPATAPPVFENQARTRTSTSAVSYTSSGSSEQSLSPESEFSEGYYDSNHLSASPTSVNFHLPRFRQRYLSDTPSLATSESHSIASLNTPPLSRTPSVQQLSYPASNSSSPISPSTPSLLPTPIDAHPGLGIIHERNYLEDEQIHTRLERALTFDDVIVPEMMARKTVVHTHHQHHSLTAQSPVQQVYPQQAHPQQVYPQQTHPQQVHPQQVYPQQAHPRQANPHHGRPQAYPQSSYPQQAYPQAAYPQAFTRADSPETIVPAAPSVRSTGESLSSGTPSSHSSQKTPSKPFAKLFSKNKSSTSNGSSDVHPAATFTDKSLEKAAKAEEKRLKKQEAKERRERLAIQFQAQEIAKQAAADAKSDGSSERHRKRQWEEEAAMYDGITAATAL